MAERALVIECRDAELVGILHEPDHGAPSAGVVLIVGGPQYRVGSHRQFVLLARSLARAGVSCLRFDYTGMGDSGGEFVGFEGIEADVRAAIDRLLRESAGLRRVFLWGLCDAASAILMYAPTDERVAGVVIANPWVRSAQGQAQAVVEQYYRRRVWSGEFWGKLLTGRVNVWGAARDFVRNWFVAHAPSSGRKEQSGQRTPFQERMLAGLERFDHPVLLLTSGDDLTAAEFLALVASSPRWQHALDARHTQRQHLAEATHTFSTDRWRKQVEQWTVTWLSQHRDAS